MKKIAIYGQYLQDESLDTFSHVLNELQQRNCDIHIVKTYVKLLQDQLDISSCNQFTVLDDSYDLMISIGGDGTILRAVSYVGKLNIPVMGINTGRLGFLATLQPDGLQPT